MLTNLPDPSPVAPTPPADADPEVVAYDSAHNSPDADGSTRPACTTHASDKPQSGRPAPDEPAELMRTLEAVLRRERWHLAQVESAPDPLSRASAASGYFRSAISRLVREDVRAIVAEFVDHTLYLIDRAEATEDGQDRDVVDERDDVDAEDR